MNDHINTNSLAEKNTAEHLQTQTSNTSILTLNELLLSDLQKVGSDTRIMQVPIGELNSLGTAISNMVPSFRTVTQTAIMDMSGLYELSNAAVGDTLKKTKDGDFWGAFKTSQKKIKDGSIKRG